MNENENKAIPVFQMEKSILEFRSVQKLLTSIELERPIGFFDMDKCIWNAEIDVEELALEQFGLIPKDKRTEWENEIASNEQGSSHDLFQIDLRYYASKVTPELAVLTDLPAGTQMNAEVMKKLGQYIGKYVIQESLYRPIAVEVLRECDKKGIRLVVLTATSVDLAEGVLDSVVAALALPAITTIGSELYFSAQGIVSELIFMDGSVKTDVVQACKKRGAVAFIGVGDKPMTSDKFIHECFLQEYVDNNSFEKGDDGWKRLYEKVIYSTI